MEVVRPPAKGDVHAPDNIFQRYRCALSCGQLRYTLFDFRKRFRCRTGMRITFARLPSLAHPDCKTQEVEALLSGVNDASLGLVQREIKTAQYLPHCIQGRIYFARTQHNKIVRITDDTKSLGSEIFGVRYRIKNPIPATYTTRSQNKNHTKFIDCILNSQPIPLQFHYSPLIPFTRKPATFSSTLEHLPISSSNDSKNCLLGFIFENAKHAIKAPIRSC